MIKTFKHKELKKLFETGKLPGIQPGHRQKLRIRLIALDTATNIEDMNTPAHPGEFIKEAYLIKPLNVTPRSVALHLKVSPSTFSRLIKGQSAIFLKSNQ
jgi:plasmid maintenance system killer protein